MATGSVNILSVDFESFYKEKIYHQSSVVYWKNNQKPLEKNQWFLESIIKNRWKNQWFIISVAFWSSCRTKIKYMVSNPNLLPTAASVASTLHQTCRDRPLAGCFPRAMRFPEYSICWVWVVLKRKLVWKQSRTGFWDTLVSFLFSSSSATLLLDTMDNYPGEAVHLIVIITNRSWNKKRTNVKCRHGIKIIEPILIVTYKYAVLA